MNRLSSSLLGAFCASLLLLPSDRLAAQNVRPPTQLTYQGFLTDGNGQPFGNTTPVNKTVVFRIYDALTGGNLKWSSQQVVTVDRGYFSVLLGQGSAFGSEPFNADLTGIFTGNGASDRYLELTADGTVIAPRLRFFPSPYAMLATSATELLDPTTGTSSLSVNSGNLNVPGALGIGTGSPVGRFHINEATGTSASSNGGTLVLDHANPGGESSIVFRSNINRGGADYGYINYQDNRTAGGENAVFTIGIQNDGDDHIALLPSGNVGINTTNPGEKLDVVGNARVSGNVYVNGSWGIGNVNQGLFANGVDLALRTSETGNIWFQAAKGARTDMFISNAGNVGIGPNNTGPQQRLDVDGSIKVRGDVYLGVDAWGTPYGVGGVKQGFYADANNVALRPGRNGAIYFQPFDATRTDMFIRNGGGVNIGPNNYDSAGQLNIFESNGNDGRNGTGTITLDHGNGGGHSSIVFRSQNNRGSDFGYIDFEEARAGTSESNVLVIGTQNDGDDHIAFLPSGYVGIGTVTPRVPLEVSRTQYRNLNDFYAGNSDYGDYANKDQGQTGTNGKISGANVSIRAEGYVEMLGAVYYSDRRIKEIVSRKDPLEALKRINQLVVTDYRMVDKVQEGAGLRTGLIAQEVATVFPEAVHSRTNFIPDIYVQASAVTYQTNDQALHVTLAKPHGFAPGNRVRLFDDTGMLETKVVAVSTPNQFTVSSTRATSALFVYGREVNDFLAVDYDRLFTTGLGAIQALSKTVDQQAQALRESQARVAELEQKVSRLAGMEGELTEIRKLLARLTAPRTGERAALQVTPEVHPAVAR
ncbi:MAG: tail fiber domain-containing protein [Verrucomicrobiota bacterium]